MNCNPVDLALKHVSEAKHLLDSLITSSESFDYEKAKLALKALQEKSRELAKVRAELLAQSTATLPTNVVAITRGIDTRHSSNHGVRATTEPRLQID